MRRLRPAAPGDGPGQRELPVDGLRGICALLVFYAHLFQPTRVLDPRFAPSEKFYWFNLGSAAVLMFFVLSGYVIGLTVTQPAAPAAIRRYASRRVLRLAPITWAAVLISWLFLPDLDGRTIAGHLLFLHNNFSYPGIGAFPLLPNNSNLWSLHYEAVYYILFIVVWRFAPAPAWLFTVFGLLAVGSIAGLPIPRPVTRYACGAFFWFGGLCAAWLTTPSAAGRSQGPWPAALLMGYAIWIFAPVRMWLLHFAISDDIWPQAVLPHRLDCVPVCLWIILAVSGRGPRVRVWLAALSTVLAVAGLLQAVQSGAWTAVHTVAAAALAVGLALWRWECPTTILARLAPLGGISFAVYVIAAPIQLGQRAFLPDFSGSVLTFTVRALMVILVVFALAWLLERKFQPWLVARIRGTEKSDRPLCDTT